MDLVGARTRPFRAAPTEATFWRPDLTVVTGFLFACWTWLLPTKPYLGMTNHVALHLALLAILLGARGAWCTLRARGLAREGSDAGFALAAYALFLREVCEFFLALNGLSYFGPTYEYFLALDPDAALGPLVWIHRNVTLVAYGYGLGLVAFASWRDARARRSGAPTNLAA